MHNSSGLPFDNSLHGSIHRQVYDNQLWIYENGFYYISARYGRIGVHTPIRENDKCTYDMHTKTNERY